MIEIARDSRLTVIGDRSRDCCDFQADHHKIQKTTQNKENGRDQPETIQNQTKGSERPNKRPAQNQHKTTKPAETSRDQNLLPWQRAIALVKKKLGLQGFVKNAKGSLLYNTARLELDHARGGGSK